MFLSTSTCAWKPQNSPTHCIFDRNFSSSAAVQWLFTACKVVKSQWQQIAMTRFRLCDAGEGIRSFAKAKDLSVLCIWRHFVYHPHPLMVWRVTCRGTRDESGRHMHGHTHRRRKTNTNQEREISIIFALLCIGQGGAGWQRDSRGKGRAGVGKSGVEEEGRVIFLF